MVWLMTTITTKVEASVQLLKDSYVMIGVTVVTMLIVVVVVAVKSILKVIANYLIPQQSNDYSNY